MRISGDITVIVVNEHWLAKKKELKSYAFCLKSVITLCSWNIRGVKKYFFYQLKNLLEWTGKFLP